ncbi:ferredoxin--NADP reductase [soil metagenome]
MQRESFNLILKSATMVTPTVLHLAFVLENEMPFEFTPGQFVTFHWEEETGKLQRSYSIATIPGETNTVEIAVSPFEGGAGTRLLFGLKPGESIQTTGPFGRLTLREEQPSRYILVATGTGVTPYRSMLPELAERMANTALKTIVLLGVQSREDLLYGDDFLRFAEKHPGFEFYAYYSRRLPESLAAHERKGYVQSAFTDLNVTPESDIVYLCGNPNMIDDAFAKLREIGFETAHVRREKYISPKSRS